MPAERSRVQTHTQNILKEYGCVEDALESFKSDTVTPVQSIPKTKNWSKKERDERLEFLKERGVEFSHMIDEKPFEDYESLQGNIENFIGFSKIPTGIAGPLRVRGLHSQGDFYIPLATSEGALVASVSRGCNLITRSGGARSLVVMESVSRAPVFIFRNFVDACRFCHWANEEFEKLKDIASTTTRHGKLLELKTTVIGKQAHLIFSYSTGDASGQNMVTIATEAIRKHLVEQSPVAIETSFIEGNMSGDKKPTSLSFLSARGKKVICDVEIPRDLIEKGLHTTPEDMMEYWKASFVGGVQSGSIGVQGHYANTLAAMFLACGQDVACVSEASVGITVCDLTPEGNFYISVTLPNLIVGTVGGGCGLPTQRECLRMLGCEGQNTARRFAEICAAAVLAGEISITGALAAGHFANAHAQFGRKAKKESA